MPKPRFSLVLPCLVVLLPAASHAQTVVDLNPTQDTFVLQADPTENFGAAGALAVAASSTAKEEQDSVIEFSLASAVSTFNSTYGAGLWSIQSITLQFTNTTPMNSIFNNPSGSGSFTLNWMESVTSSNNWTEGTGTPSNQPNTTGISYNTLPSYENASDELLGTYSYTSATSGNSTYTLGLPGGFLASAATGNIVSFDMLPVETSGISSVVDSENFTTSADRPVLAVTAVPEPASLGLLLGSTLLLTCRRRRVCR